MHTQTFIAAIATLTCLAFIPSCPAPPGIAKVAGRGLDGADTGISVGCTVANCDAPGGQIEDVTRRSKREYSKRFTTPQANGTQTGNDTITLPPGVSQHALDECTDSMKGKILNFTQMASHSFRLENVAAPCMDLATVFTDKGRPIPCANDCLDYKELSDGDKMKLYDAVKELSPHKGS